jgi:hypothetical protein
MWPEKPSALKTNRITPTKLLMYKAKNATPQINRNNNIFLRSTREISLLLKRKSLKKSHLYKHEA